MAFKLTRVLRGVALLALAAVLTAFVTLGAQNGSLYLRRLLTYPHLRPNTTVSWYDAFAEVRGQAVLPVFPQGGPLDEGVRGRITQFLAATRSTAFLVLHRGRLLMEWYAPGVGADMPSNSMSMMKSVLSLLVGALVDRGLLPSADEPLAPHITEWSGDSRGKITLRQLLQNTSGLREDDSLWNPFADLVRMHLGADADRVALALPQRFPAGETSRYNNGGFQVLGLYLERRLGRPFPQILSEHFWSRAGARNALISLDRPGGRARTYCCLFATPRDWAQIGELVLEGGRLGGGEQIVSSAWLKTVTEPTKQRPSYATGFWTDKGPATDWMVKRRRKPFLAKDVIMMDGQGDQKVYVIPEKDLVIVRIGDFALGDWDDSFLPNEVYGALAHQ